jgi:filamentous hemagglutinin family protein
MAPSLASIYAPDARRCRLSSAPFATVLCLTGLCWQPPVFAAGILPQGGQYVAGTGTITQQGSALLVTQPGSTHGIVDWKSFSIGSGNRVTFDNGTGATLNRVTGASASTILGHLSATGSLYLINPQGVVIGPTGVVTTGGRFVASSLDVDNDAFMKNDNALAFSGKTPASVVNLGKISSSGGDIFLIARDAVFNTGTVSAPEGTAEMAAGDTVLLHDAADDKQLFVETGSHGAVINSGQIRAAQINLQAADGNVYALAGKDDAIRATGTALRDGHVWLVADDGRVDQRGVVSAHNANGGGGTVDTEAARLEFGKRTTVRAGQWNVTAPTFTLGTTAAGALRSSLNAGTDVNVTTTGTHGATGDIGVTRNLVWHGDASLSLAAFRNVSVSKGVTIANNGAGNLTLRADASGIDNSGSVVNRGTLDWSRSTGAIGAFYDMNGRYDAGMQRTNSAWTPGAYSGLLAQITGYKLVNSLSDLQSVGSDLAGNYALGKDIDASATSTEPYMPIGNAVTPFTGQFDGQGHRISSLTPQAWLPDDPYGTPLIGMFGEIGNTGIVRNLNVEGTVAGTPVVEEYYNVGDAGIAAAVNNGTILRVNASGKVSSGTNPYGSDDTVVGGLVGVNGGNILRSSSTVEVGGGNDVGGLVGDNSGLIRQSFSSGSVDSDSYVNHGGGGLVDTNRGTIDQSYSTSPTLLLGYCRGAADTPCGGAALVVDNEGTISQSFATGLVTQPYYQPIGIARTNNGTIAPDVYWDKDTTAAAVGVVYGTPMPAANGYTTAQMSDTASFATYDFSATGAWAMPAGATHPILRWQLGE